MDLGYHTVNQKSANNGGEKGEEIQERGGKGSRN